MIFLRRFTVMAVAVPDTLEKFQDVQTARQSLDVVTGGPQSGFGFNSFHLIKPLFALRNLVTCPLGPVKKIFIGSDNDQSLLPHEFHANILYVDDKISILIYGSTA